MIKKLTHKILHPGVLALGLFVIVILFLPPLFSKYRIRVIEENKIKPTDFYHYCDLNFDGTTDELLFQNPVNYHPSLVLRESGKIVDQWNFEGDYPNREGFICFDYDRDSVREIFLYVVNRDSLVLVGINPYNYEEPFFFKKSVDVLPSYDGLNRCSIKFIDTTDHNKDGFGDLVFSISTGLVKQPRNLYRMDFKNDSLTKSPESGIALQWPEAVDINGDGFDEYTGSSCAFGNVKPEDSLSFPDTCAWLMVFDKNLDFLFRPKSFGQFKTYLEVAPFKPRNRFYIAALQLHKGHEDVDNKLMLFDHQGQLIREKIVNNIEGITQSLLGSNQENDFKSLYLLNGKGKIFSIDSNLNIRYQRSIPEFTSNPRTKMDIDADGKKEMILSAKKFEGLIILRADLSSPLIFETHPQNAGARNFSMITAPGQKPVLCFQKANRQYMVQYARNPLYPFKYLIWIGIYLSIFLLLYLLQKIQNIRAEKKFEATRRINELQLKTIKGQTDPHFTLNLIESIGNLFYKKDSERAAYVFSKYAKLLRTTLLNTETIAVTIEEEIAYVKNYMDLEKFRYDSKFDYNIEISDQVNTQTEIPKMLIHTFVENAIKHGIKHKVSKGFIEVMVGPDKKGVLVLIRDNGVGRAEAKEYSRLSTGKGLKILNRMLELYEELKGKKIRYDINDLTAPEGKAEGTLVKIHIPQKTRI